MSQPEGKGAKSTPAVGSAATDAASAWSAPAALLLGSSPESVAVGAASRAAKYCWDTYQQEGKGAQGGRRMCAGREKYGWRELC